MNESETTLLMDEVLHHQLRKASPYQLVQNFSIIRSVRLVILWDDHGFLVSDVDKQESTLNCIRSHDIPKRSLE